VQTGNTPLKSWLVKDTGHSRQFYVEQSRIGARDVLNQALD
jgi:hypothetical protein